jgi:hypothetical protein
MSLETVIYVQLLYFTRLFIARFGSLLYMGHIISRKRNNNIILRNNHTPTFGAKYEQLDQRFAY